MWLISGRLGNQMFQFAYIYAQVRRGLIPNVYLQDKKFFEEYGSEIRKLYGDGIASLEMVSIHVRRKDYVDNDFYVDLFKNGYYKRAMELFPDEQFIVFSDDIEWCKKQEIFKRCTFSYGDEIADMNLMASCKHNIIANSSYSWWAAYLNPNPNKKVVAPKDWYTLAAPNDDEEKIIYTKLPDSWIKV